MSYSSQVNRSSDSGASSLQRSGLNISVGDTKSIVMALQALQQKIRALERDRDYHQDQYERSLQANEAYKLEMESQMEQERAAYRKREEALREQLQRLLDEKRRLESDTSNEDLAQFRKELETMIAEEKHYAQERESKLVEEIERLRNEVEEEKRKHSRSLDSIRKIREEREEACRMNEQLRMALDELLSREERRATTPPRHSVPDKGRRKSVQRSKSNPKSTRGQRPSYRDPTVNSILRDIRNVSGETPCAHEDTSYVSVPPRRAGGSSPTSRNTSALRTRPNETTSRTSPRKVQENRNHNNTNPHSIVYDDSVREVEAQVEEELASLQAQYRNTVTRAAKEDLPETVVTSALSRITSLIENKKRQLELLRSAAARPVANNTTDPSVEKAVKRNMLVNELREMLAQSSTV